MNRIDHDLMSVQEARILIENAREAQKKIATYTQQRIDEIVEHLVYCIAPYAKKLAMMAYEETGFGNPQDKYVKNLFASKFLYKYIKNQKTIGIIDENTVLKTMDIGIPLGVIVALLPSTNPTATAIYKSLIAIKSGNAIVFSPHPKAKKSIFQTLDILIAAVKDCGVPDGAIAYQTILAREGTVTLMNHPDTALILANTTPDFIELAHHSGKPTINGGPGNGPAFIERTADIAQAVKDIITSKTFDNGLLCSSEQSIVAEECIAEQVKTELKRQGSYFMNKDESERLSRLFFLPNGKNNSEIVGRTAIFIAKRAGFSVPETTKILVSEQQYVSHTNPYSREKLCPVLAFYIEKNWMYACEKCIELLVNEGKGHTLVIHSRDESVIRLFALRKPVSRMLVNTPASLGGIGFTTNLPPALTLSTGAVGGGFTADNISPLNLINIRKVGYGVRTVQDVSAELISPCKVNTTGVVFPDNRVNEMVPGNSPGSADDLGELIKKMFGQLG